MGRNVQGEREGVGVTEREERWAEDLGAYDGDISLHQRRGIVTLFFRQISARDPCTIAMTP